MNKYTVSDWLRKQGHFPYARVTHTLLTDIHAYGIPEDYASLGDVTIYPEKGIADYVIERLHEIGWERVDTTDPVSIKKLELDTMDILVNMDYKPARQKVSLEEFISIQEEEELAKIEFSEYTMNLFMNNRFDYEDEGELAIYDKARQILYYDGFLIRELPNSNFLNIPMCRRDNCGIIAIKNEDQYEVIFYMGIPDRNVFMKLYQDYFEIEKEITFPLIWKVSELACIVKIKEDAFRTPYEIAQAVKTMYNCFRPRLLYRKFKTPFHLRLKVKDISYDIT